jgi:hypothetical protein
MTDEITQSRWAWASPVVRFPPRRRNRARKEEDEHLRERERGVGMSTSLFLSRDGGKKHTSAKYNIIDEAAMQPRLHLFTLCKNRCT